MPLSSAIVLITLALVFYSIGVWAEHLKRQLTWSHVLFFGLGLICDIAGTAVMSQIAAAGGGATEGVAGLLTQIMSITGALALIVMAVHFTWAVVVLVRNRSRERAVFHKFSLGVWILWLIPYFTGAIGSMAA